MGYDNTNSGALFDNDRKQKPNHPDLKGSLDVEGKEYWASGWFKKSRAGKEYISIALTPKDEQPQQDGSPGGMRDRMKSAPTEPTAESPATDFDDDIPF